MTRTVKCAKYNRGNTSIHINSTMMASTFTSLRRRPCRTTLGFIRLTLFIFWCHVLTMTAKASISIYPYEPMQVDTNDQQQQQAEQKVQSTAIKLPTCLLNLLTEYNLDVNALNEAVLGLHHNGVAKSCASVKLSTKALASAFQQTSATSSSPVCDSLSSPYVMEAFMTNLMAELLLNDNSNSCAPEVNSKDETKDNSKGHAGFYGHCDRGPDHTVVQLDHEKLVKTSHQTLPCRFFTREGVRIASLRQFVELLASSLTAAAANNTKADQQTCDMSDDNEQTCKNNNDFSPTLRLYAAPAGRVFMFAPSYVGETFDLLHVTGALGEPISLKVLSLEPRVFDVYNFFSPDEATALMQKALSETSETHKLHRSTTGTTSSSIYEKRTSENAWDTHGPLAQKIKRRSFTVLGLDKYHESHSDGLQILRYNLTTAYIPHTDYLEDTTGREAYDYDPSGRGGNRFATILLYMTDLPENGGGETVFTKAWPANTSKKLSDDEAIQEWRHSHPKSPLKPDSWQERMAAQCATRLSVRPHAARAVLFYSQYPDGVLDPASLHGGCPVLNGTKWAANLWVWSAPRPEYQGGPLKKELPPDTSLLPNEESDYLKVLATFTNTGKDKKYKKAVLHFEDDFFSDLPIGEPLRVNTFESHEWNIVDKYSGKVLKRIVIGGDQSEVSVVL